MVEGGMIYDVQGWPDASFGWSGSIVLLTFTAAYLWIGRVFWGLLRSAATTPDELDFVVACAVTPLVRVFAFAAVLTWPLWAILPAPIYAIRSLFRRPE